MMKSRSAPGPLVVAAAAMVTGWLALAQPAGVVGGVAVCPLSQGYWKTHAAAWPQQSLVLGSATYSKGELLTLLRAPVRKDASLILATQLIAAKLNVASGSNPAPIDRTVRDADAVLSTFPGKLPYGPKPSSTTGQRMVVDAGVLDRYNRGLLPDSCGTPNTPPVANAGEDQTVVVGDRVQLDGSASVDVDGDSLSFRWKFVTRPAESAAELSDPGALRPTFTVDAPGRYEVELAVSDGRVDSAPDAVVISTANSRPVADAGPDQTVPAGARVVLDGRRSHDADRDPLSYRWRFVGAPAGSGASLEGADSDRPDFVADLPGRYTVELVVNDGALDSDPDQVVVSTENSRPVADAGLDREVVAGEVVQLDASGSRDADGDALTFRWALTVVPDGSAAALSDAAVVSPRFVPDVVGVYVAQVIVNDGQADSDPDTVSVTARDAPPPPPPNRPPVAVDDEAVTAPGTPVAVAVLGNDSDPDGDPLALSGASQPANGAVTLGPTTVTYAPGAGFHGVDGFTYTVADGRGGTATGTVRVIVNQPPVVDAGADQTIVLPAVAALHGTVTDDGVPNPPGRVTVTWSKVSGPGTVSFADASALDTTASFSAAGPYVLRLSADDGLSSASDEVTVTVTGAGNRAPVITSIPPTSGIVGQGYRYPVQVADPDGGNGLTFSLPIAPADMSIDPATGVIEWTPTGAQTGQISVAVKVQDPGGQFATQGFSVQVGPGLGNAPPVAQDDAYEARVGETLSVPAPGVLANDSDPDGNRLTARQLTQPRNGTARLNPDGSFTYTPYRFREGERVATDHVNLAMAVPGVTTRGSSFVAFGNAACLEGGLNHPLCAVDGTLGTSWLTHPTDNAALGANSLTGSGPFLELTFPQDIAPAELRVLGHREPVWANSKILAGVFQLFDASGAELFDSGVVDLPAPERDGGVQVPALFGRATNIARTMPGVIYRASSILGTGDEPARAFDGNLLTQWQTRFPAVPPEFLEAEFPTDVTVDRVKTYGLRQLFFERDFLTLVVQAFDAAGNVLFDSGTVAVPADRADTTVQLGGIGGIRRVRVTGTTVETPGVNSGLAEMEVISVETVSTPLNDRVRRVRFTGTADNGSSVGLAELRVMGSAVVERQITREPNLGQLLATTARASSSVPGNPPESAIDDSIGTNWYAQTGAAGEFLELEFPLPVTVTQIVAANPSARPDFFGTSLTINCSGSFTLLGEDGGVLFDSGVVNEPSGAIFAGDTFTLAVPGVTGVRRVRYTSAGCGPFFPPGFSALTVFGSAPVTTPALAVTRKFQGLLGREVHSTPAVINLTDDNGDGKIDRRDIPDIVVVAESVNDQLTGEIKVISGDDGRELFTAGAPGMVSPWSEVAVGDLDGDGLPEIVAVHSDGNHLIAFDHTGQVKWISDPNPMPRFNLGGSTLIGGAVSIANLDGGPRAHVIVGASAFDADGRLLGDGRDLAGTTGGLGRRSAISAVADLDLDGTPEIVAGPTAYRLVNGQLTKVWQRTDRPDGYVAIGNLDDDPRPEIVVVGGGFVYVLNQDGTDAEFWNPPTHAPVPIPGGGDGGAPTIADVDGDGIPEIGVAGASAYTVFNGDGSARWSSAISDRTSHSTGSTAFDFDGDGAVEIVYRDENFLRIYRGADGVLLAKIPMESSTWAEMPVVVDVDNDGHADIVVTSDRLRTSSLENTGVYVIQDVANAWVRTRRIWNQHAYHVTNVDEDGTIPAVEAPHWLLPGGNTFRLNAPFPGETADQADSFTYVAGDGALESNVATVRTAVRTPNGPPRITSAPVTAAAVGLVYAYAAGASDPDPGDVLTFSLPTAPARMTIEAASGLIRWTPTAAQLGAHDVVVKVRDVRGAFALQGYTVQVSNPVTVPDVVGQARAAAEAAIAGAGFGVGTVGTRPSATVTAGSVLNQSPAGGTLAAPASPVSLVVSTGPPPQGTVPDVVGQSQPSAEADIAAAGFAVGAVTGQHSATAALGVVIAQSPGGGTAAPAGSAVAFVVSLGLPPGDLDLDGDGFTGNQGDCDDTSSGINPGAVDIPGDGIDQNCNGRDSIAGDDTLPTAVIDSPAEDAVVTMPVDVVGTATDPSFLRYTLEFARVGQAGARSLAEGVSPVVSGVLGRLDPTLLENGLYQIRLTVEDVNGQTTLVERVVRVDGMAKVGHFRLTFTDLSVPLVGIPITLTRTYDSRVKSHDDFGIGWTLDVTRGFYRHNRTPGEAWQILSGFLGFPCTTVSENASHLTEVRLSDHESYTFALTLSNPTAITGGCLATASFRFIDGRQPGATLEILDGTDVLYVNGDSKVVYPDSFLVYNPTRVRLTIADGRVFHLDPTAITRIEDPNGNTVTFTRNGAVHSSGKSVAFTRDSSGRIIRIVDPAGHAIRYSYDDAGDLVSVIDQAGHETRFAYDTRHNLTDIADALGRRAVRTEYDDTGRLVAVVDASGNRRSMFHDLDARQQIVTDRLGNVSIVAYDVRGNIVRTTDPLGGVTTMTYDARDNVLSETDALGRTRTFGYDERSNRVRETDASGNTTTYTYTSRNQPATQTDAEGGVTSATYDVRGNPLFERDPLGHTITSGFDDRGNRTTLTDPLGNAWTFTYDAAGRAVGTTDPVGHTVERTFDANGNVLTETSRRTVDGSVQLITHTYQYDALNRRVQATGPEGDVTRTAYTPTGRVATTTDPLDRVTRYVYDEQDRLIATEYPDGTVETIGYDAEDRVTSRKDRAGRVTTFAYDAAGRRVSTAHPGGTVVTFAYDAAGQLVRETDERGGVVTRGYDAAGRETMVTDQIGNVTVRAFDGVGRVIAETDRNGNTTAFTYDAAGQLTRTTFADGTSITLAYDARGALVAKTDEAATVTQFAYNARGDLSQVRDGTGATWTFTRDEQGNRATQTDPLGRVTAHSYDRSGRLLATRRPLGQTERRLYDAAGNVVSVTDANGTERSYAYDAMNRVRRRTLPLGERLDYAYTATGQPAVLLDPRGALTIEYDARDRPILLRQPDGQEISYAYDAVGNRAAVVTPAGATHYSYDAAQRLRSAEDPTGRLTTFTLDPEGNLTSVRYGNGVVASHGYDRRNRLTSVTQTQGATTLGAYTYSREPTGHVVGVVEHDGRRVEYAYDQGFRLTEERVIPPGGEPASTRYTYDAAGNRLTRVDAQGTTTCSYDGNDRLLAASTGASTTTFAYDDNGNVVGRTVDGIATAYQYDALSRLRRLVAPGGVETVFGYDALDNRVSRDGPDGSPRYLVDPFGAGGLAQVLRETDGLGGTVDYVYARDVLLSREQAGEVSYYLGDLQGSTRRLTDGEGNVTDAYSFDAFGNLVERTGTTTNDFLYNRQQFDGPLGLYYLRARYYDATLGRFTVTDPLPGNPLQPNTLHRYVYATGDPMNRSDPSGRTTVAETSVAGAGFGVLARQAVVFTAEFVLRRVLGQAVAQVAKRIGARALAQAIEQRLLVRAGQVTAEAAREALVNAVRAAIRGASQNPRIRCAIARYGPIAVETIPEVVIEVFGSGTAGVKNMNILGGTAAGAGGLLEGVVVDAVDRGAAKSVFAELVGEFCVP